MRNTGRDTEKTGPLLMFEEGGRLPTPPSHLFNPRYPPCINMCGIAGQYSLNGTPPDTTLLSTMGNRLAHRGPDGQGMKICGSTGLAHRRLAIIDLTDEGLQPMTNEDGTLWLGFN